MDLFLLILSMVLAAGAAFTARALKREHAAVLAATDDYRLRDLGHYELAYLAGGAQRVADTAVGLLANAGDLRVARGGRVHHVEGAGVSREPVEETVLTTVAANSGIGAGTLGRVVAGSLAVEAVKRHLATLGMIKPDGDFARANRLGGWLGVLSTVSLLGAGASIVMLLLGGAGEVLLPAVLVFAGTKAGAAVIARRNRRVTRDTLTASGREALDAAIRATPRGQADTPAAVALYGLGELHNAGLRAELLGVGPAQARRGRTSYGGGGSSTCASSTSTHGYGGTTYTCASSEPAHGYGSGAHSCGGSSGGGGGGGGCGGGGCGGGG